LYRKLANISGELEYTELKNTSVLKQLSGEDTITMDRKYKEPFTYRNYAKLIFLTNEINKSRDTTEAFYRRLYLIEFPKKFKQNPQLLHKIETLPEEEWEGLLVLALDNLRKLWTNGLHFTIDLEEEEMEKTYNKLASPLTQFIEENCIATYDREDFIFKFEFLQRFKDWLAEKGRTAYTDSRLKQEMGELGFDEGRRGEKNYRCWVGIGWKNKTNQEVETVILEEE